MARIINNLININVIAKNHGKQIRDDKKYDALRDDGMSKEKAAHLTAVKKV
ncbi:hypothetical protein [Olivibacter sp. SDN3]|uniref:DUF7218 family protein n=1 Tax=Olivibacter sp. SDN3 TaxID=2764720 RepID=UPI001C9E26FD|nr:hypothetical protein [Olivibacter sp. SDN3]